ncbi:hypothetical protein NW765_014688 [Fusarium oxysporum]|nr:hypothetical protein NW765_014688 [Fusarium oxysporum]
MSSEGTSQAAATDSASGPGPRQSRTPDPPTDSDHEPPDSGRQPTQVTQSQSSSANTSRHRDVAPRDFVRLFQCQICSLPLDEPISLPLR